MTCNAVAIRSLLVLRTETAGYVISTSTSSPGRCTGRPATPSIGDVNLGSGGFCSLTCSENASFGRTCLDIVRKKALAKLSAPVGPSNRRRHERLRNSRLLLRSSEARRMASAASTINSFPLINKRVNRFSSLCLNNSPS